MTRENIHTVTSACVVACLALCIPFSARSAGLNSNIFGVSATVMTRAYEAALRHPEVTRTLSGFTNRSATQFAHAGVEFSLFERLTQFEVQGDAAEALDPLKARLFQRAILKLPAASVLDLFDRLQVFEHPDADLLSAIDMALYDLRFTQSAERIRLEGRLRSEGLILPARSRIRPLPEEDNRHGMGLAEYAIFLALFDSKVGYVNPLLFENSDELEKLPPSLKGLYEAAIKERRSFISTAELDNIALDRLLLIRHLTSTTKIWLFRMAFTMTSSLGDHLRLALIPVDQLDKVMAALPDERAKAAFIVETLVDIRNTLAPMITYRMGPGLSQFPKVNVNSLKEQLTGTDLKELYAMLTRLLEYDDVIIGDQDVLPFWLRDARPADTTRLYYSAMTGGYNLTLTVTEIRAIRQSALGIMLGARKVLSHDWWNP